MSKFTFRAKAGIDSFILTMKTTGRKKGLTSFKLKETILEVFS